MKHLKKYEAVEYSSLYNVGDYVYMNPANFVDKTPRLGKIITKENDYVPYEVLLSNGYKIWSRADMILRKMTDEEIEQYEIELNSTKYNL